MKKFCKMNELYWLFGNLLCAVGIALCTKAGLGMSMIAAPPYILSRFLSRFVPFLTQGVCEYLFQAVLLVAMCIIVGRFRLKYLFSFATAFIFGNIVDGALWVFGGPDIYAELWQRIFAFILGEVITATAIACYFRTELPLCVYELIVVEISSRFNVPSHRVKLFYDLSMLMISVGLSVLLFGGFVGIGIGTVIITLVNSHLIKWTGVLLDKLFDNQPAFPKLIKKLK